MNFWDETFLFWADTSLTSPILISGEETAVKLSINSSDILVQDLILVLVNIQFGKNNFYYSSVSVIKVADNFSFSLVLVRGILVLVQF
jgi:hypothetical protein